MGNWRISPARKKVWGALLIVGALTVCGWVSVGDASPQATTGAAAQAKPGEKPAPKPAAKPAAAPAEKTKAAKRPSAKEEPAGKTKAARKASAKKAPAGAAKVEQAGSTSKEKLVLIGKRDPFKLPMPPSPAGGGGPGPEITGPLPPGSRGLVISQLRVEGIVRLDTTNTMIALVTNYTNRAYFLRENDAVYNGVVTKITPDSVIFSENFLDPFGRMSTREVVKRLGS